MSKYVGGILPPTYDNNTSQGLRLFNITARGHVPRARLARPMKAKAGTSFFVMHHMVGTIASACIV